MVDDSLASERHRAPTIREVATFAGVSKSLVSMVLREDPGVSPERRRAVLQAMSDLGYEPNRVARALAGNGTGSVGVLINDLGNPWFVDLLDGVSTTLGPSGVAPLLVDSATNQRVGRSSVQILVRQRVDGIIAIGTSGEEAELASIGSRMPLVLAGTYDPDTADSDVVVNDDVAGARLATEHLLALGHRRVTHLRGPERVGSLREEGYRQAMTEAGLQRHIAVEFAGMGEEAGHDVSRRVLGGDSRPTGIVAYNDLVAIEALAAADDLGLSCPADVSIVGYDDARFAGIRRLSLTTISNGTHEIGVQATLFLLERIAGHSGPRRLHQVSASLVERQTTGPAADR